jgi:hypothetical protein
MGWKNVDHNKMRKWNPNGSPILRLSSFAATFCAKMGWTIRSKSKFWRAKKFLEIKEMNFQPSSPPDVS